MLEILYNIASKEVRAWNADMEVTGNLNQKEGQEVVIWNIDPPDFESDWYKVDLENQTIVGNPDYEPPEPFDPRAEIDEIKAKMVTSEPPTEMTKVSNIYYDPTAKEIQHTEGA